LKIVFDNDNTITDFNKFIEKNAVPYFQNKYGLSVKHWDALEIEDMLDIKNVLIQRGYTEQQAELEENQMLNEFWVSYRFLKYSLLNRFRKGAGNYINELVRRGHNVQIYTSRMKSGNRNLTGKIVRGCTILQYWLHGVFLAVDRFHFFESDEDKIQAIAKLQPNVVFEDKAPIVHALHSINIKVVCVSGRHNQSVVNTQGVVCIESFEKQHVHEKMEKLLGKTLIDCAQRGIKSERLYRKALCLSPIVKRIFHPIVLNPQNILQTDQSVIYVSNHRSTLDPLIITAVLKDSIHWVALKRFFKAEDSIFNNSKNPVLCRLTAWVFRKLEFFPIERKKDNPNANNYDSLRDMTNFLRLGYNIGIFPEGTTRRPEGKDFGEFDSSFVTLAKKNHSYIQPITVMWVEIGQEKRMVLNFDKAFTVETGNNDEHMKHFSLVQQKMLEEIRLGFEGHTII
jgi:1-acyl-sn-glycerol-3-phosphate acyltransferase